ncbi:putative U box domain, armadillo-like helical, Zinc finger, RING/FYVE/PHD-type [Dioscorea sansibarensis]
MEELDIPSYFLCPISLDLMRDPVTLSTGITFDRDNIERWIFSGKRRNTCPVTNQALQDLDLTPNHTLRRLIQAWCTANTSKGVERFPTPRQPISKAELSELLVCIKNSTAVPDDHRLASLLKLKSIVLTSERNKRYVEASGAVDILVSIIKEKHNLSIEEEECSISACDEALSILCSLGLSDEALVDIISINTDFVEALTTMLRQSNYQTRAYASLLLRSMLAVIPPVRLVGLKEELFEGVVRVIKDKVSYQASKAGLRILAWLCPWGRNRMKAVEAGAVTMLIELLLDEPEKMICELILLVLDLMCGCAEGRSEMMNHAAGIAVVSRMMLRVSSSATERSVRILHSVSKFSATPVILNEMLAVGTVSRLCLVIQVDCGVKTKEKVKEILRLHSMAWKHSPCLSPQLHSSYPS